MYICSCRRWKGRGNGKQAGAVILNAVLVTGLNVYVSQGRYWPFSHKRTNKSSGWTNRLAFVGLM